MAELKNTGRTYLTIAQRGMIAFNAAHGFFTNNSNMLDTLDRLGAIGGDRIYATMGGREFVVLQNPDDIGQILAAPATVIGHSRFQAGPVGIRRNETIVTNADGEEWKAYRKAFSSRMDKKGLKAGFIEEAEELIRDHIDQWKNQPYISVSQEASRLALKFLFKANFNLTLTNEQCDSLHNTSDNLYTYLFASVATLRTVPKSVIKRISGVHKSLKAQDAIVLEVLKAYQNSTEEEQERNMLSALLGKDAITAMTPENKSRLTALISELLVAGHLSVRTEFYWALHHLARNTEYQEKIRREASAPNGLSLRDMRSGNIPFTYQFTLETLRRYPHFYIFLKEPKQDFIGKNGLHLSKGTTIMIAPWLVHRNPEFYERPNDFDPETHFSIPAMRGRNRFAFTPFGHGPHNCPGEGMFYQQIVFALGEITKQYDLSTFTGEEVLPPVQAGIFMRPDNKSVLQVTPR